MRSDLPVVVPAGQQQEAALEGPLPADQLPTAGQGDAPRELCDEGPDHLELIARVM